MFSFWMMSTVGQAQTTQMMEGQANTTPPPENVPVFLLPPNPRDSDRRQIGQTLTRALGQELNRRPAFRWVPLDSVGLIHDVAADLYASSCPPDEIIGCAYVLGDRGGAKYAVATHIELVESGTQIEVHLINVEDAEAAFSFQIVLAEDNATAYAEGVAKLLFSLATGRIGQKEDIRDVPDTVSEEEAALRFKMQADEDLQALASELGGVSTLSQREHGKIERPKISREDLMSQAQTDGLKPWERLNMSAGDYLRYQNSDLSLYEWRKRAQGRRGQLLLRPQLSVGRSWVDTTYRGQVLSSEDNLEPLETWAWQSQQAHVGAETSLSVGYGLTPLLEVGVLGGTAWGTYQVQIDRSVQNQTTTEGRPFDYPAQAWTVGGYVRASGLPDWSIRPAAFAGMQIWWGSRISDQDVNLPPAELPDLAPARFMVSQVGLGAELRLGQRVDFIVDVPAFIRAGGVVQRSESSGVPSGLTPHTVPDVSWLGFGARLGLQVRLLGQSDGASGLDAYEDE